MDLTGADRYNPNMLTQLQSFATEEITKGGTETYSLPANLALLRIYVTQPDTANTKLLSQLLVKAMMRLPDTDFATMLHLVPERLQEEQPIASLVALMQHLEGARYQSFWLASDACKDILSTVPGFAESIRSYIITAVSRTCQKISRATLSEYLRLDGAAFDNLVSSKGDSEGWKALQTEAGKAVIQFPISQINVRKEQQNSQSSAFRFDQLSPVLTAF